MENEKKRRNSGIEFLKIMAMMLIALCHAVPIGHVDGVDVASVYMDVSLVTMSIQRFCIVLFRYGGQLGNIIFIVCSAWFLLDSKHTNAKKIMYMIADCFFVSVLILICFLLAGYRFGTMEILQQLLPTYLEANWFIGCYILMYMIHPLLNNAVESASKEQLLSVCVGAVVIYAGLQFLRPGSFFYTNLIGFVCIYFWVAYDKKYLQKTIESVRINSLVLALSLTGNILLVAITNLTGLHMEWFTRKMDRWAILMNPFLVCAAMAMFHLAIHKQFSSRRINYIAGLSMLIYIIHANRLVLGHLRYRVFAYIYSTFSYRYEIFWVFLVAGGLLVLGLVGGIIYRAFCQRISHGLCDWLYDLIVPFWNELKEKLLKME